MPSKRVCMPEAGVPATGSRDMLAKTVLHIIERAG
jgi:hypothetical protein